MASTPSPNPLATDAPAVAPPAAGSFVEGLYARATAPIDAAGPAFFRVLIGLLGLISCLRFLYYGWVDEFFVRPRYFFKFWGFEWVEPLSASGMRAVFVALAVVSGCVAAGFLYRLAIVLFFLGFTYVQLLDVTNYLNHYYLISLLALLMSFMPLGRVLSVDAWLFPSRRSETLPAWCSWGLRFQVGVVYFFAGLAKLQSDWLLHAQPLNIWLSSRSGAPIVGPFFEERWLAYAMSWAGFLFDTTIPLWLSLRKTRPWAFAVVILFHAVTSQLFPIGMFPFIMVVAATSFFSPDWPRRVLRLRPLSMPAPPARAPGALSRVAMAAAATYALLQVTLPFRTHLYGGNVLWHEQGMRFSWRVMVREKNGSVTYRVEDPQTGKTWEVSPRRYLDDRQAREFSTQPDMIAQLGRHVARDWSARLGRPVVVKVDALASLNGRPAARLIDPEVDLASVDTGIAPARWILPSPSEPPIHLRPTSWAISLSESRR